MPSLLIADDHPLFRAALRSAAVGAVADVEVREADSLDGVLAALEDGPATAYDLAPRVYGEAFTPDVAAWLLSKLLCFLTHLQALGRVERLEGEPERWARL